MFAVWIREGCDAVDLPEKPWKEPRGREVAMVPMKLDGSLHIACRDILKIES